MNTIQLQIVNRSNTSPDIEAKSIQLQFCVLQGPDRLDLRAVLHEPDVKCSQIAASLGLQRYSCVLKSYLRLILIYRVAHKICVEKLKYNK